MATKSDLIGTILDELRKAQQQQWKPPPVGCVRELRLPPSLPLGGGRQISATDDLLVAVSDYSKICLANEPTLKSQFKKAELNQIAQRAFAVVLESVDLAQPNANISDLLKSDVDLKLREIINSHGKAVQVTLGCHLFDGDPAYPISIGPVLFEAREQWRLRFESEGKISKVTSQRLSKAWSGGKLRKRASSYDAHNEESILDTIGRCPIVCTVATSGLSSKMTKEKSLLAARVAMLTISLMWVSPSQGLEWMNLRYDGQIFHRHYVLFNDRGYAGSSSAISQLPSGRWTDSELISDLRSFQWLFDVVGAALFNFVQPLQSPARPKITNALFLSLWWFYEACRETSDQMATTKFAASMDALTSQHNAGGIIKFIGARLGVEADSAIMTDGRTVKKVVTEFYVAGRSRLIHGSSEDFAHDWSGIRSGAESIGRHCIVAACDWLNQNPQTDNLADMSQP